MEQDVDILYDWDARSQRVASAAVAAIRRAERWDARMRQVNRCAALIAAFLLVEFPLANYAFDAHIGSAVQRYCAQCAQTSDRANAVEEIDLDAVS